MTIEVPITNIELPKQNIDLLKGKCKIGLLNPWFDFQGIEKPKIENFMTVNNTTNQYTKKPIYMIKNNPLIVYKLDNGNFTKDVLFTLDKGEQKPTTNFKLFDLNKFSADGKDKYASFKTLQRIPSSRGSIKEFTKFECSLNYCLTQAYEICFIAMILEITDDKMKALETDRDFINLVRKELKTKELDEELNKYNEFNNTEFKYLIKDADADDETKFDLLWILRKKLFAFIKSKSTDKDKHKYFNVINRYSTILPATYSSNIKVDSKIIECIRTDFNFSNTTKHRTPKLKKQIVMKSTDFKDMINDTQAGKFYITIDFDYRINGKEDDKQMNVMRLRYIVKVLLHKHSSASKDIEVNDKAFDFGDDEEDEEDKEIGSGVGMEDDEEEV